MPALTGKGYEEIAVSDGGFATQEFPRVTFGDAIPGGGKKVRRLLEVYCGLDSSGMPDIVQKL